VIRIAIGAEAFAAIEATMPLGGVAVEPAANVRSEREIWLDEGVLNRDGARAVETCLNDRG
jgi:hypothetical protein